MFIDGSSVKDPNHGDPDPDPAFHFDADPDLDPNPSFHIKARNLKIVFK